ncbi:MAG: hypothetical protein KDK39_00480 [Leptospiraceae bacterium]|nr:hypothetical protein [Leptospiraceae bacterium]
MLVIPGLIMLTACSSSTDELDAQLIGPADLVTGSLQVFKTSVDSDLTTSCGTATASTSSSSSSSDSSTSSSSSTSSTVSQYTISSYIQFVAGETLLIKYTYDEDEDSFRMIPSSSSAQTCPTTDFISCNGTEGVNPTCETTDNISCGGADSFIFTSKLPVATFEGSSGTIDWQNGYSVNSDGNTVEFMDLEFDMVSSSGAIMSGTVRCTSN